MFSFKKSKYKQVINEYINIYQILSVIKNLESYEFYSPLYGQVKIQLDSNNQKYPIKIIPIFMPDTWERLTEYGKFNYHTSGEVLLFPSYEQRDWEEFDIPKTDLKNIEEL